MRPPEPACGRAGETHDQEPPASTVNVTPKCVLAERRVRLAWARVFWRGAACLSGLAYALLGVVIRRVVTDSTSVSMTMVTVTPRESYAWGHGFVDPRAGTINHFTHRFLVHDLAGVFNAVAFLALPNRCSWCRWPTSTHSMPLRQRWGPWPECPFCRTIFLATVAGRRLDRVGFAVDAAPQSQNRTGQSQRHLPRERRRDWGVRRRNSFQFELGIEPVAKSWARSVSSSACPLRRVASSRSCTSAGVRQDGGVLRRIHGSPASATGCSCSRSAAVALGGNRCIPRAESKTELQKPT